MKTAQDSSTSRNKKTMSAFPDYSKGLVSQRWLDPKAHAKKTSLGTGALGAALGIALARVMGAKKPGMALGALVGAVSGGIPGYKAGLGEAESENGRMLFLRRRLGVSEPGEYDAMLQHGDFPVSPITRTKAQRVRDITDKHEDDQEAWERFEASKEAAVNLPLIKSMAMRAAKGSIPYMKALGAGTLAYGVGSEVTPRLGGYQSDDQARRISGMLAALPAASIPLVLHLGKGLDPVTKGKLIAGLAATIVSGEIVPTAVKTMNNSAKASQQVANATSEMARATAESGKRNLGGVLSDFAQSGTAKGLGVGAGLAGLGAIGTGLSRAKNDDEIKGNHSRMRMIGGDFLKFLLPALAAGGAIGSVSD